MDPRYYTGEDNRDELTEPEMADCESCGATQDQTCTEDCTCVYCQRRAQITADRVPVGIGTGEK